MQIPHQPVKASLAPLGWLGVTLLVLFSLLITTRWLFPLPVEHSTPWLVHESSGAIAVEFDLTSHVAQPVTRTLRISLEHSYSSRGSGQGVILIRCQDLTVALSPAQTRRVHCEFPEAARTDPDCAEVTFLPQREPNCR